jgi:hypothetical protein
MAAGAVAVFAVAMGIVTGVEVIGQQPVSALVGDSSASGTTTIGALTNTSSYRDQAPSTPNSPTTQAPATPSAESTPTDVPSEPDPADRSETETSESTPTRSASPSAEPTDPAEESSEEIPASGEGQSAAP